MYIMLNRSLNVDWCVYNKCIVVVFFIEIIIIADSENDFMQVEIILYSDTVMYRYRVVRTASCWKI